MLTPHYKLFDHTADLGVRVIAPTLPELVWPATRGLYATIGELAPQDAPRPVSFELTDGDPAYLLRDYLAELLHLFEHERRIITIVEVREFADQRLRVTGQTCPLDEERSSYEREVKAITYHELEIRPVPGGYELKYIVDI